ncbi:MAG: right-handed parallel beta-helix repeat-containing protein [Candidatus Sumerlaeota bacterium]|nr:right-handed parallel beta-helix repeat-containing protein [Candidatus Sumerlaeota bacterium]
MKKLGALFLMALIAHAASAAEYHVSVKGNDGNEGSASKPYKTISAAAKVAQAGDAITVHEGTYRERVTPPRGGESDSKRIVYQAAAGEKVVIKGSEVVRDWKLSEPGVWKTTLPNSFFGSYNPYKDLIAGDWFNAKGRPHHTGEVYLNGKSLFETHQMKQVQKPQPLPNIKDPEGSTYTWLCESDDQNTTIYANFHDKDPNKELVEINVRDSCFYPDQPGRDYITIRGFRLCQAATQWAAPTAEQIGLIGTHWSKGWIIENNEISDSKCSGITLGKDRKTGHNVWTNDPKKDGATHYNEVIVRALEAGWSRGKIGSHIVRNNVIHDCEQTGICGSLGGVFSQITGNHIYNIWTKRQFTGAEIAGIKIHASIDMLIKGNRIHGAARGMWMDWMAQGTRITGNLCYDNSTEDLFVEVDHGPFIVDNNLFLSGISLNDMSEGGAYAHNLIAGKIMSRPELRRTTPYHKAHSTAVTALINIKGGDDRFYGNIFVGDGKPPVKPSSAAPANAPGNAPANAPTSVSINYQPVTGFGLWVYDKREYPLQTGGNVYYNSAQPYARETNGSELAATDPEIKVAEQGDCVFLQMTLGDAAQKSKTALVTTKLLEKAKIPGLAYENADGTPVVIDTDYLSKKRDAAKPSAGPFENPGAGKLNLRVW